ncbi:MAG: hypothetical protein ACSLFH_01720 [Desulfuromonadales bacterium]
MPRVVVKQETVRVVQVGNQLVGAARALKFPLNDNTDPRLPAVVTRKNKWLLFGNEGQPGVGDLLAVAPEGYVLSDVQIPGALMLWDAVANTPTSGKIATWGGMPWIDIRAHGNDLQVALDSIATKGTILIPENEEVVLTSGVTCENKDITLIVHGVIKDEIASFTKDYTVLSVYNKAAICFRGGRLSVFGSGRSTNLYGPLGVGGVSQNHRPFILGLQLDSMTVDGIVAENGVIGSYIGSYHCNNIRHTNGRYTGGGYPVLHSSVDDCYCDNLSFKDGLAGGLIIHNRGDFLDAVLPRTRSNNIRLSNLSVQGGFCAVGGWAVGITVDTSDNIVVSNCFVDGENTLSFAYSWAATTDITVSNCVSKNMMPDTTGGGAYVGTTYAGFAMECDNIVDGQFFNNVFNECGVGYVIINNHDTSYDGVYRNNSAKTASYSTGAIANANYAVVAGKISQAAQSDNVTISGNCNGGNRGISVVGDVTDLTLCKLKFKDHYLDGGIIFGGGEGDYKNIVIDNVTFTHTGIAKRGIYLPQGKNLDFKISNIKGKAAIKPGGTIAVIEAPLSGTGSGDLQISGIKAWNYDRGFSHTYGGLYQFNVQVSDCMFGDDASAMVESDAVTLTENSTGIAGRSNIFLHGKLIQPRGSSNPIILSVTGAPPTTTPMFNGQIVVNLTSKKIYMATGVASSADWTALN